MATEAPEKTATETPPAGDAAPPRRKLPIDLKSKKVRVVGLLIVIMIAEAVVMSLLMPKSPAEPAAEEDPHAAPAEAGGHGAAKHEEEGHGGGHGAAHGGGHGEETAGAVGSNGEGEVLIGKFSTTNSIAEPTSIIHISFELSAVIASQAEFDRAKGIYHGRMREAIEKVCRSASLEDLGDPHLSKIRQQIRDEVNKVLRASFIIEVVITDFKTVVG